MLEGEHNNRIVKAFRARGLLCFKLADRFQFGIPDIYVQGGRWVEGKVIKCAASNKSINVWEKLTPKQQTRGEKIWISGDRIVVAIRVEIGMSAHLFCEPFRTLQENQAWRGADLALYPQITTRAMDITSLLTYLEL